MRVLNAGQSTDKLPASEFTAPAGKEFKSWEVDGAEKKVGKSITVNKDTTVKAIWKDKAAAVNKSVITIDPAGGKWADGTTTPKTYTVKEGMYLTLPDAPVKEGYTFLYWKGSRYNPGDKYQVTGDDHTFTAACQKKAPETGDSGMMYVYALGMLLATGLLITLNVRRSKGNQN